MRKLRKLFLAAIMVVGFNLSTQAQEVAHINVSELIPAMPESKAAQTELTNLQEKYRKEMETMQKDFEAKLKKYQEEAPTAGDALNETRGKEMQELQERFQLFQQTAQQ